MKTLVINIGGTSTKVGIYEGKDVAVTQTIRHQVEVIKAFKTVWEQYEFRRDSILEFLASKELSVDDIDLFISRGPVVKPLFGGVYAVDEAMIVDAKNETYGRHVCSLGCAIAFEFSKGESGRTLIADPPCTDEMIPIARYTGLPQIERRSFFQALSHKALGRALGEKLGRSYDELALVITHLGSGISVASHLNGRVIDLTNGLGGDSPFGMDRPGTLPASDFKKMIQSGDYSDDELNYMLSGGGGFMAHLGTNDGQEVEARIDAGDTKALEVYEAMAFQVAKALGAAAAALGVKPDAIAITGGLAHSKRFTKLIKDRISWISEVHVMPDIDEVEALAHQGICAYHGEIEIKTY